MLSALAPHAGTAQGGRDTTAARRDTAAHRDTTRAPADTGQHAVPLPSDTLADTTKADTTKIPKDTLKTPIAHAPVPPLVGTGPSDAYHWDRDSIFSSGAQTLADLLLRIPGVTMIRSGWLASPQYIAYLGDPARVRVFYDGVEIDPLDPRSPGALDMAEVQLWTLEDISAERGADELRVYLRSWRVERTTTNTRIDVSTGDQGTNIYRGFFGKRYDNGLALQIAGQQYGTSNNPTIGGGSELSFIGRVGWAKGWWSIDAFASRAGRTRDEEDVVLVGATGGVPEQDRTRTDAYFRAAYSDPDRDGPWAQLMVSSQKFNEHSPFHGPLSFAPADSADTTRSATQYIATAGFNRGGLRLSAAERFNVLPASTKMNSLSGRLAYLHRLFSLSLFADYRGRDTTATEEAALSFTPLSFLSLTGAVTRRHGGGEDGGVGSRYAARGELGLRVHRVWLTGGVMKRAGVLVPGLSAYDTAFAPGWTSRAVGIFGTIRGKFYKDLGVDVEGIRWTAAGYYRPQMQSHEELYLDTKWLSRFPSGNFGFYGSVAHEYRQNVLFPVTGGVEALTPTQPFAVYNHVLVTRIEIRIEQAVLFFNSTYGLTPPVFEYVPGFLLPRQRLMYGVRWQFWN